MEKEELNSTQLIIKWAFINLLTQIILTYIIQYSNIDKESSLRFIGYGPMVIYLFLVQKEFKLKFSGGYFTTRQGISVGFSYSIAAGSMFAAFIYIYLSVLNPQILQNELVQARLKMQQRGMNKIESNHAIEIIKSTRLIFGSLGKLISYTILGIPFSALGAAILKKTKMTPFANQAT